MTNVLATNAVVPKSIETPYYLKASKQGFPISGQVPRTYQVYTGTGGTIDYDGSNEIRIFGQILTSPLIINFGPTQRIRNMVGRLVTINIIAPIDQTVTLNSSPAFMLINGTALQQLSHVIPADNLSKSINVYFSSEQYINVDYGASSSSVVSSFLPENIPVISSYVYGTATTPTLPSIYIPDSRSYDVTFNDIEPIVEGAIVPITTSVTGPGIQNISFDHTPAPRKTTPTTITGYLSSGGTYHGLFTVRLNPILTNVHDVSYFTGAISSGALSMYSPFVDPGGPRLAYDADGIQVTTPNNLLCIEVDIKDSLLFYVLSASPQIIRWRSFITGNVGILVNVGTLPSAAWSAGATIVDMAFNETESSLLVLPNGPSNLLLRIPVSPYDQVSSPTVLRSGPLLSRLLSLGAGTVPYAIAVCPHTGTVFIAQKPMALNNSIYWYHGFNNLASGGSYQHPTINTGRTSMTVTSRGELVAQYESNLSVNYVANVGSLVTWVNSYTAPDFYTSLSRNCYGWTSV